MIIPKYRPYIDLEEIKAICSSKEDVISEFEKNFARNVKSRYALTFSQGRSALYAILKSLDIKEKEILLPSYTCAAVPSTVLASNNIPKFTDINLTDYNIILDDAIKRITKKTKAIIPVHTYGYPVDIRELKRRIPKDIYVIEDAALSLLTKDVGKYGDVTFYSLDFLKQIHTSGGGVITTDTKEIYDKLKEYSSKTSKKNTNYKEINKLFIFLSSYLIFNKIFFKAYNIFDEHYIKNLHLIYMNGTQNLSSRDVIDQYCKIQAKVGLTQLKKIHDAIKKARWIANFYNDELCDIKNITLPPLVDGASYSKYTIRVKKRDEFQKNMQKKGIYVNNLWSYSAPYFYKYKKYTNNEKFINSFIASQSVINLPIYPSLYKNYDKLGYIVKTIKKYSKKMF
jgi:perosamine synthetase